MSSALVLCYHALSPDWRATLNVRPEAFEAQLTWLVRKGYRGVTFEQAVTRPPEARTVCVTFDDAYRSVIQRAFPILERLELPATVFAVTAFVGAERPMSWAGIDQWQGTQHERELAPMSWDELRRLRSAGWEVGSHTDTHPRLTQLDDPSLQRELERSRELCEERLGSPCPSLAYPYGDVDDRVVQAARRAGYRFACTLPERLHAPEPLLWPRVGVYVQDSMWRFRMKTSPVLRRVRSSPGWKPLNRMRRRLA